MVKNGHKKWAVVNQGFIRGSTVEAVGICVMYAWGCFRCIADVSEGSYPRELKASSGFNNPRSVEYLSDLFGLRVHPMPSLMRGLRGYVHISPHPQLCRDLM